MKIKILLFIIFVSITQLIAQSNLDSNKVEYSFYPMVFYTPETQFAFGAGGIAYYRLGPNKKLPPSKIVFSAYYTTNNQYLLSVSPALYFAGSAKIRSESKLDFRKEVSRFYGIGNNSSEILNPEYEIGLFKFHTELSLQTGMIKNLYFGFIYEFTKSNIINLLENPILNNQNILGKKSGIISGFGSLLVLDYRNNVFFPTENIYAKLKMIFMSKEFGSDFTFNRLILDFRKYQNLGYENIIASQIYIESSSGDIPFFMLPALGGSERMRGYFLGRYMDEVFFTWQVEYRKIIWNRIGAVAFLGMGDVANKFNQFNVVQLKYNYGFGLRYVFDEKEKLNVRMDLGFGNNTSGIYFALEEAF
ncbi:MAG: hypothetical protein COW71_12940 [Ignavibacteriales bacterium CG18_big_fil_WC_8_21_14_2_50_31_20]|nr:MAG: hypothetical protein COW71_12940 [Ignavibacteriales bacterium CG18_big_fil_WC_8_21_14_2_50_31_20]